MINYGRVKGSIRPNEFELTATSVIVTSTVQEYTIEHDGQSFTEYEYDYIVYNKDEYITTMLSLNTQALNDLSEELEAAKIILGVE